MNTLPDFPWDSIKAWSNSALPLLESRWPDYLEDFRELVARPRWKSAAAKNNILGLLDGLLAVPVPPHPPHDQSTTTQLHDPSTKRDQVFISYSHQDNEWLEKLRTHLSPYERNSTFSVWDDTRIGTGSKWRDDIRKALASAKVAVLLVSPHFLSSHFIADHELPTLLEAAAKKGLTIIWIPIRASAYTETEIAKYQAAHDPSQPLASLNDADKDEALVKIGQKIKAAVTP